MITTNDLRWHHAGTSAFAIIRDYTITDTILSNPESKTRYSIYAQTEDGDELHLESYPTLTDVLHYINKVAA